MIFVENMVDSNVGVVDHTFQCFQGIHYIGCQLSHGLPAVYGFKQAKNERNTGEWLTSPFIGILSWLYIYVK